MDKKETNKKPSVENASRTNDKDDKNKANKSKSHGINENKKLNLINERELILLDNAKTFLKSAKIIYDTGDFTSASTLYFKALFSILDLIIFRDKREIPKDHSERFRTLEKEYASLYIFLAKLYPDYRNAYNSKINKQTCDRVKEDVERVIKEQKIFESNQ